MNPEALDAIPTPLLIESMQFHQALAERYEALAQVMTNYRIRNNETLDELFQEVDDLKKENLALKVKVEEAGREVAKRGLLITALERECRERRASGLGEQDVGNGNVDTSDGGSQSLRDGGDGQLDNASSEGVLSRSSELSVATGKTQSAEVTETLEEESKPE